MAHGGGHDHDEDEIKAMKSAGSKYKDFDCPTCNANNPVDEPLSDGGEVRCNYCGLEFRVTLPEGGRPKFKEI